MLDLRVWASVLMRHLRAYRYSFDPETVIFELTDTVLAQKLALSSLHMTISHLLALRRGFTNGPQG